MKRKNWKENARNREWKHANCQLTNVHSSAPLSILFFFACELKDCAMTAGWLVDGWDTRHRR
jgi:hypothetical protein